MAASMLLTHSASWRAGNWERGTYMIGLWNYFAVSQDPEAKAYLQGWAQNFEYKLCGENSTHKPHHHPGCPPRAPRPPQPGRRRLQGACEHDSLPCVNEHNANNQLCGATYIEMYKAGAAPRTDATLADTKKVFAAEMAVNSSTNFWSWLDASFMAMNTWSRLAEVTGDNQYYKKQWANFNAAMLLPANGDGLSKGPLNPTLARLSISAHVWSFQVICAWTELLPCLLPAQVPPSASGMIRSTCSTAMTATCTQRSTGGAATAGRWAPWSPRSKTARTTRTVASTFLRSMSDLTYYTLLKAWIDWDSIFPNLTAELS